MVDIAQMFSDSIAWLVLALGILIFAEIIKQMLFSKAKKATKRVIKRDNDDLSNLGIGVMICLVGVIWFVFAKLVTDSLGWNPMVFYLILIGIFLIGISFLVRS